MPRLIVTAEKLKFGKDILPRGAEFNATDKEARLLIGIHRAAPAQMPKNSTDIPSVSFKPAMSSGVIVPIPSSFDEDMQRERPFVEAVEDEAPKPKRRYIRRDMRADDDPD